MGTTVTVIDHADQVRIVECAVGYRQHDLLVDICRHGFSTQHRYYDRDGRNRRMDYYGSWETLRDRLRAIGFDLAFVDDGVTIIQEERG